MRIPLSLFICFILACPLPAQKFKYSPLDPSDPVYFSGKQIIYRNDTITLGPKAFFIDGSLSDKEAAMFPYVYNSVNKAAKHLSDGREGSPMVLCIAPYVYWIDDPDDPEVRDPGDGSVPYGLEIKCEWLRFYGLNQNAENVVLACNRGQTLGAKGNFTMFRFDGDGTSSENITFGNYCNVDLVFPLKPELNRSKRADAIVQAQLIHCNGDKIVARNTRFISRLNLCNFVGAKRILFDRCHMESTDDALCGSGVYKNCTLDFYSSKPFYHTSGTGAVFLNCDIRSMTSGKQYFTKANGQLAVIDTRFTSNKMDYLAWRDFPPPTTRNYQYNVSLNRKKILISADDPKSTVSLKGKPLLNAYRLLTSDVVVYNTYNLLKGNDDWDPEGIKPIILKAEKQSGASYHNIPVQLKITPSSTRIETNKDTAFLQADLFRFGNFKASSEPIDWHLKKADEAFVRLIQSENGEKCTVIPMNRTDSTKTVVLEASTASGLEGAAVLTVKPAKLDAPGFISGPVIIPANNGTLKVSYQLEDTKYDDHSLVSWFRCTGKKGENAIKVAVSRQNRPYKYYPLTEGDVGYYIMARVEPNILRSDPGPGRRFIFPKKIKQQDISRNAGNLHTTFMNVCVENQAKVIPGFWTFAHFDTTGMPDYLKKRDAWYYGEGSGGSRGKTGLLQTGRTGSMSYTPVGKAFGNMKVDLLVSPFKTAGQGFSVAPLYMDVLIKYDAKSKSGYGLRFIRTTKYANTVDCYLVHYANNKVTAISEAVTTSCYRTPCSITLEVNNKHLTAHAECLADYNREHYPPEVTDEVTISTVIEPGKAGGFGIEYNGGSTAMINEVNMVWDE